MNESNGRQDLIKQAKKAMETAYVPYSNFSVGAAVLANGDIFDGCNIENASYGLTNCAERTAIFKAISAGNRKIDAIAVIADTDSPVSPCGACRQVIAEFSKPDTKVYLTNLLGNVTEHTVEELLPGAFQATDM